MEAKPRLDYNLLGGLQAHQRREIPHLVERLQGHSESSRSHARGTVLERYVHWQYTGPDQECPELRNEPVHLVRDVAKDVVLRGRRR